MAERGERDLPRIVGAEFDFQGSPFSTHIYAVASTERSRSTLFCNHLWQTELLGAPTEYFNFHHTMFRMIARFGTLGSEDYLRRLFACRTTPNGVFGVKIHWPHLEFLILANLLRHFSTARWIVIERQDTVAQAISLAKAIQTSQWASLSEPQATPSYSFKMLRNCHRQIQTHRSRWRTFFKETKRKPFHVYFSRISSPRLGLRSGLSRSGWIFPIRRGPRFPCPGSNGRATNRTSNGPSGSAGMQRWRDTESDWG